MKKTKGRKKKVKEFVASFGRIPVAPPTRVKGNRRGRGSYNRSRAKREWRREAW